MTTALVVDDNPALRMLMVRALKSLGYKTDEATNGVEAEDIALKRNPDVILMDLMMPFQNGYETCENLRKKGYTGYIILASALLDLDARSEALAHGADTFLAKPVDFDELRECLKRHSTIRA